jgi:hypothetical protein
VVLPTSRNRARLRLARRGGRDDGAAAVEFAIVLPILVLILFGIVDYGLYFSNSISVRSGLQAAARQAVVANFDQTCDPPPDVTGATDDVGRLICMVKDRTDPLGGTTYVKVVLPTDGSAGATTTGWYTGQPLVVCAVVVSHGVTGWVPLPGHGVIRTKVVEEIEQHAPDGDPDPGAEESPPGGWGTWCTA